MSAIEKVSNGYSITYSSADGTRFWFEEEFMDAVEFWVKDCTYYPYNMTATEYGFLHEHRFEDVIKALLYKDNARKMNLDGCEEYYGSTELRIFNKVKEKRLEELNSEG